MDDINSKFEQQLIGTINQKLIGALQERGVSEKAIERLQKRRKKDFVFPPKKKGEDEEERYDTQVKVDNALREALLNEYNDNVAAIPVYHDALVIKKKIARAEDFTFYREYAEPESQAAQEEVNSLKKFFEKAQPKLSREDDKPVEKLSYDCTIWLWAPNDNNKQGRAASGRALACLCEKGTKWSITFRKIAEYPEQKTEEDFLNKTEQIDKTLFDVIFAESQAEEHGLIVVAGRTATAKTTIARGLLIRYLEKHLKDKRKPHLLTFEDPIEKSLKEAKIGKYLQEVDPKDFWEQIDYTPREKIKDAVNIREVINNALRQTPKVLFIGETREQKDWNKLLEFAGTGHLVITTAHAGSLSEAMSNLLRATKAQNATKRSEIADRLLALIHLRRDEVSQGSVKKVLVIPALWHRTPTGIKALMAEGLTALLPKNPKRRQEVSAQELPSSIGRRWFASKLLALAQADLPQPVVREITSKAIEWDLEGI